MFDGINLFKKIETEILIKFSQFQNFFQLHKIAHRQIIHQKVHKKNFSHSINT